MAEDPPPVRVQVTDGDKGLVWTADGAFPASPDAEPVPVEDPPRARVGTPFWCPNEITFPRPDPTPLTPSRPQSTTVFARCIA